MSCKKCSDNKCSPKLPAHICPIPYGDDGAELAAAFTGCLGVVVVGALCLWVLLAVLPKQSPLREQTTAEKIEKPYSQFPLLSKHCETCKQCANPISETGEEQSLCEEGFRLLQEDVRNSKQ